jgi:hypothetical protein
MGLPDRRAPRRPGRRPARLPVRQRRTAAFVARELGDGPENDMARRLTYDRDLAVEAARGLLAYIAPR